MIRAPRGIKDHLPEMQKKLNFILNIAKQVANSFVFEEVSLPIFELSSLYQRCLGESTDIVSKEMYSFTDKGNTLHTLRPEFTAGVVRSVLSNNLENKLPIKWFSHGPLFRYERPQKGRLRQFHQLNFEYIGEQSFCADLDIILICSTILKLLRLENNVKLELNSLGCKKSRQSYRDALYEYFADHKAQLSEYSKIRLEQNPMRILDSKENQDKELVSNAPQITDYYSAESKDFFGQLCEKLTFLKVDFEINPLLVRGLDYYRHTVFEFTTEELGSQNAVAGGGRYDGLFDHISGKERNIPAVGCAIGIERIIELYQLINGFELTSNNQLMIIAHTQNELNYVLSLVSNLRDEGVVVLFCVNESGVSKTLKKAEKKGATHIIVIGEDEVDKNNFTIKDLVNGSRHDMSLEDYIFQIKKIV